MEPTNTPIPAVRPRLCWSGQHLERIRMPAPTGFLGKVRRIVLRRAQEELAHPDWHKPAQGHNWHLLQAREAQGRVFRAMAAWMATGNTVFREEIGRLLFAIADAEYWSWVAWRNQDPAPDAIFDLSYGENSATLAFLYDWMAEALTAPERTALIRAARERAFAAFLKPFREGVNSWWKKPHSNCAAVCAGGAGLLSLALLDEVTEAAEVLEKADAGVRFYLDCMAPDGGWVEGVGYWNYGHYYAFRYLLSWENTFGKVHSALKQPSARNTVDFPLLFTPHNVSTSFGDYARFQVMPFHLLAAQRFRKHGIVAELRSRLTAQWTDEASPPDWPVDTETWLAWPETIPPGQLPKERPFSRSLQMGWAVLADRWPQPTVFLSLRGGSSDVPHGHHDLSSFEAVIDGERLIGNVRNIDYLDTTFSSRRYELYELTQAAKNVLLINGTGFEPHAEAAPQAVKQDSLRGFILDMSHCMGTLPDWSSEGGPSPAARLYRRGVFLTPDRNLLIIDRIVPNAEARLEVRLHTEFSPRSVDGGWHLKGIRAEANVRVFADIPIVLTEGKGCPSSPRAPADFILRAMSRELVDGAFIVTLISRHPEDSLICVPEGRKWRVQIKRNTRIRESLVFARDSLNPARKHPA